MCKMFEVVTGKKSKGSVDKLEGLTKMYTDINEEIAIIKNLGLEQSREVSGTRVVSIKKTKTA